MALPIIAGGLAALRNAVMGYLASSAVASLLKDDEKNKLPEAPKPAADDGSLLSVLQQHNGIVYSQTMLLNGVLSALKLIGVGNLASNDELAEKATTTPEAKQALDKAMAKNPNSSHEGIDPKKLAGSKHLGSIIVDNTTKGGVKEKDTANQNIAGHAKPETKTQDKDTTLISMLAATLSKQNALVERQAKSIAELKKTQEQNAEALAKISSAILSQVAVSRQGLTGLRDISGISAAVIAQTQTLANKMSAGSDSVAASIEKLKDVGLKANVKNEVVVKNVLDAELNINKPVAVTLPKEVIEHNTAMLEQKTKEVENSTKTFEIYKENADYMKTPAHIKDLDGKTVTVATPRDIAAQKAAVQARTYTDENAFELDDGSIDDLLPVIPNISDLFGFKLPHKIDKEYSN